MWHSYMQSRYKLVGVEKCLHCGKSTEGVSFDAPRFPEPIFLHVSCAEILLKQEVHESFPLRRYEESVVAGYIELKAAIIALAHLNQQAKATERAEAFSVLESGVRLGINS